MTAAAAERFPRISPAAPRYAVGLMAGTSLDGIDAALARIEGAGDAIRIETLATHYQPYTPDERAGLLRLIESGSLADLCAWDAYLGERFARAAQAVIQKASPPRVDCIGSHGQTVWHAPDAQVLGTPTPNTLQIGQPDVIAARVGVPVVADFRTRDMAYGGQGAPLVPLVDWLLLRNDTEPRAALNLGGMANLTVLPAGGAPDAIRAFDTGPANALIDLAVQHGTGGTQTYDRDGALAESGAVHPPLLEWLLAHPYFGQPPPKSTGREVFGRALLDAIHAQFPDLPLPTLVATLTELTAATIADALQRWVTPTCPVRRVIVSGGGLHNRALMRRLAARLPDVALESSAAYGVDPDFKEAIAFAVLADRFLQGLPATYPSTTGVRRPTLAGKLALP
jgi:Predicted molecular chaperone distantly related to HSP70-fold metalloproteases